MKTKIFQAGIGVLTICFWMFMTEFLPVASFAAGNGQDLAVQSTAAQEVQKVSSRISGAWHGTYRYDDPGRGGEIGHFTMNMDQQGSVISGTISEPNSFGVPGLSTLSSTFSGTFDAGTMQINFTKIYDYDRHQVEYSGTVHSSGNEAAATGRWRIGDYAGSWEMNR